MVKIKAQAHCDHHDCSAHCDVEYTISSKYVIEEVSYEDRKYKEACINIVELDYGSVPNEWAVSNSGTASCPDHAHKYSNG